MGTVADMTPSEEWKQARDRNCDLLRSPVDLNEYFESDSVAGIPVTVMDIGPCSIPSGRIEVRDPMCYLGADDEPYLDVCPPGEYTTEVCVIPPIDGDCARYAAVRLVLTGRRAETFGLALVGDEDLDSLEDDDFFGFPVDSGLACICDLAIVPDFVRFEKEKTQVDEEWNLYDDYFADLFAESYRNRPEHQRDEGDWINWTVPGTGYRVPIFQTGFGDGLYPVYFGYDSDGGVCQVVVQFIDIALAYSEQ